MERPRYDPSLEREYVARGWWADDTLSGWLARHAAERPQAPAVVFQETTFTWRALEDRVLRVAGGLSARGVGRGDVVAVQLAICVPQAKEMFAGKGIAFSEIDVSEKITGRAEEDAADPFLLLYTAGTTAAPKGMVHPYRTFVPEMPMTPTRKIIKGKLRIQ